MATYTKMTSGVSGCTSQQGWYDIISISECGLAAQVLGLADTSATDDGQNGGVTYDPPFCYYEQNSLKFNKFGANSGTCTNNDQCLCTNQYNAGASIPPPSPSPPLYSPPPPSPSPPPPGNYPPPPSPSPPDGPGFEFPIYLLGPIVSITWLFCFIMCAKQRARQQNTSTLAAVRSFTQRRRIHNGLQMQAGMSMASGASMMPTPQAQMATPIGVPMATPGVAAVPMATVVDATPIVQPAMGGGAGGAGGAGMSSGVVEELEKLHQMKVKGILTEAQFQAAKDKVLQQPAAGTTTVTTTTTTMEPVAQPQGFAPW